MPGLRLFLFLLLSILLANCAFAQPPVSLESKTAADLNKQILQLIEDDVREKFIFYGLASYYNNLSYYIVDNGKAKRLKKDQTSILQTDQYLVVTGRHNVLAIRAEQLKVTVNDETISFDTSHGQSTPEVVFFLSDKEKLGSIDPELETIKYSHLWAPLAWLTRGVEWVLIKLHTYLPTSWGITVLLFSILVKIAMMPFSNLTTRAQRRVSKIQTKLAPKLADIKANLKGESAHEAFMKAHRDIGVTPYYTLSPLIGTIIQIPVLIAIFNALAEMPQFSGQSFLWISDISRPDAFFSFGKTIPFMGNTFNLMPFIMTAVMVITTLLLKNSEATKENLLKQKRNLYFMAAAFFVIFYTFPSVMVYYWTLVSFWQWVFSRIPNIITRN